MEAESGACAVCEKKAKNKCGNCGNVFYCTREHQKEHWRKHKQQCSGVRVRQEARVGRYLQTCRRLAPGDVVIRETPLLTGPAQVTPPVCLGCYRLLTREAAAPCARCGWPMCGETCPGAHNHTPECVYTQQRGEKVSIKEFGSAHPFYQSIMVLRLLYQRETAPALWSRLMALESHTERRRDTDRWTADRALLTHSVHTFFKLAHLFDEEIIMKCAGIIQVNAHEVPLSEPCHVALYELASLPEHSCRPNCGKSFSSAGELLIVAGAEVETGGRVSVCYTDPLWGTEARRHHLAETKFFECLCPRCEDPTELATMFSAVKCQQKSCKGYILPETFIYPIMDRPTEKEKEEERFWMCDTCKDKVGDETIQKLLEAVGRELSVMPKQDPDACEKFIEHCSKYLHPHHYYMTDVALALAQLIGQTDSKGLAGETQHRLALKTQLCRKLAELLLALAPAEHRARGSVLFELHAAIAETGRRKSLTDGPVAMLSYLTESREVLAEAAALLRHEPAELPEGRVALQAVANLREMDTLIRQLSAALPAPL